MSTLEDLKKSLLHQNVNDENVAVLAEDLITGSGIDFEKTFFEPQVGKSYLIKILPNPGKDLITHRAFYTNLPDPDRKGKTFRYTSSNNPRTCPVLELFFDLNDLKKQGDIVAEKKIDKYLGKRNQACVKVQILSSENKEEIGQIKLLAFSTFGPNPIIANLIDQKLNPTKQMIEQGFEKEDISYIFGSAVLSIVCEEATFEGKKGRDFGKSSWAPKRRGAIGILEDGKTHEFSEADLINNGTDVKDEIKPYFEAFLAQLTRDEIDTYRWFSYKEVDDPRNDKETNEYLKSVMKKVEEIVPVIRDMGLQEIANYGRADKSAKNSENHEEQPTNILEDSIPDELQNTVLNEGVKPAEKVKNDEIDDILAG